MYSEERKHYLPKFKFNIIKSIFYVDLGGIYCDETIFFFNSTKELSKLQLTRI